MTVFLYLLLFFELFFDLLLLLLLLLLDDDDLLLLLLLPELAIILELGLEELLEATAALGTEPEAWCNVTWCDQKDRLGYYIGN